jgi:putative addiction module killer protein
MIEVCLTETFAGWLRALPDRRAQGRIAMRMERMEDGNFGDVKSVGGGVSEMRINYGPGYRVYFTRRGQAVVILLCGGDKSSQSRDIAAAQAMAPDV